MKSRLADCCGIKTAVTWFAFSLSFSLSFTLFIALAPLKGWAEEKQPDKDPNILIIYLDDFGWRDCGYMGSDFYETPHIDQLSKHSLVFTNAYSCCANCAPARASLLSGQYSPRHRIFNVGTRPRGKAKHRKVEHIAGTDTLDRSIETWAQNLKKDGYRTATLGKWHLSDDPVPYGFDINIGGTHSGSPPKGYYPPHNRVPGLKDAPEGEYLTDRLSAEAVKFIKANAGEKWCLYLTHFAVHTPIQAKRELVEKYQQKPKGSLHQSVKMATMIESVDTGVGQILATLKELGLYDDTVIFFYSDNGGYGPVTDMDPLKGYKGTFYEGGIRVPFFVHWPEKIGAGTSDVPITGVDLYPTLCAIAGTRYPENQPRDGVNLLPLFRGEAHDLKERPLFWHFPCYLQGYRKEAKEQRDSFFRTRPCGVIRKGDWKLIQYFEDNDYELFNLHDDIGETKNLFSSHPEKLDELKQQLSQWQKETGAPIPKRK